MSNFIKPSPTTYSIPIHLNLAVVHIGDGDQRLDGNIGVTVFVQQRPPAFKLFLDHCTHAHLETSAGLDRTILMLLSEAYREEEVNGETRTVLKFHPQIAPITVAVLPLVKKDGMPEVAHAIEEDLRRHYKTFYDEKGAIGRRYRRMDEAGTPFCLTIDGQTLDDGTVTLRDRDSMEQVRVPKDNLATVLFDRVHALNVVR